MRRVLFSILFLSLLSGCSVVQKIGPHRIDVQQGNALDPENVARLKPGLTRSQVRFLLGTPLVVDPFRNDRWDYVYVFYEAGRLVEQKRITLFFDGDVLSRIEGDVPPVLDQTSAATPTPVAAAITPARVGGLAPEPATASQKTVAVPAPLPVAASASSPPAAISSIVKPLPSPKNAPDYVDPRAPAEPGLASESGVSSLSGPSPAAADAATLDSDPVLISLNAWANAWARRDSEAYLAAYDRGFAPQGGQGRADWETRQRVLLGGTTAIDLKIESPSVARAKDGSATVTFNQLYRAGKDREEVIKQLRMIERDGRWLIVEEKVLSVLPGSRP
ncbi:MAG: outer membrane protein assembly factor BamE [Thiobacillus sp.]|nr:outer membrane protein assembly factor BamE [Thiobacillus sp.]